MNRREALAILLGTSLVLAASPGRSQVTPTGPLEYITMKPPVIRAQVELGARLADEAISTLENAPEVEQLEKAKALVSKSYHMLRFATHGIEGLSRDSSGASNYGLRVARDWLVAARERNIAAGIAIDNSIPWVESRDRYVAEAMNQLKPVPELAQRASRLIW